MKIKTPVTSVSKKNTGKVNRNFNIPIPGWPGIIVKSNGQNGTNVGVYVKIVGPLNDYYNFLEAYGLKENTELGFVGQYFGQIRPQFARSEVNGKSVGRTPIREAFIRNLSSQIAQGSECSKLKVSLLNSVPLPIKYFEKLFDTKATGCRDVDPVYKNLIVSIAYEINLYCYFETQSKYSDWIRLHGNAPNGALDTLKKITEKGLKTFEYLVSPTARKYGTRSGLK